MKRIVAPVLPFAALLVALSTRAQPGSTGALPPTEPSAQPVPSTSATTEPAPSTSAAPPTAPTTTAQPQPQPQPQQSAPGYPPPGYPPPGYGYGYGPPQPAPPPPPPKERPKRSVSLTLSPLHLLLPVFEANLEVRVVDHFGIAAIGGYGTVPVEDPNGGGTEHFDAYELGGQLLAYPMEPFDKLVLGAELLYVHVSADNLEDQNISGVGVGYAVGPLAGYKIITDGGFTFVAQGGFQYVFIQAEASDNTGTATAQDEESRFIPLLNLNIGWSF